MLELDVNAMAVDGSTIDMAIPWLNSDGSIYICKIDIFTMRFRIRNAVKYGRDCSKEERLLDEMLKRRWKSEHASKLTKHCEANS